MDELKLPLVYNGEELELPLKMYAYGYTFRVEVSLGNTAIVFEPMREEVTVHWSALSSLKKIRPFAGVFCRPLQKRWKNPVEYCFLSRLQ